MNTRSAQLGYLIVSLGVLVQFTALAADGYMRDGSAGSQHFLGLSSPNHIIVLAGMLVTAAGALFGMVTVFAANGHGIGSPRLLPIAPLFVLGVLSLGSASFAYQMNDGTAGNGGPAPLASADQSTPEAFVPAGFTGDPTDCPDGYLWHEEMGHCMTPEQIAAAEAAGLDGAAVAPGASPADCPAGFAWHEDMGHCMETYVSAGGSGPLVSSSCPAGQAWHPEMGHCMAVAWEDASFGTPTPSGGAVPSCPAGQAWHEQMGHCMAIAWTPGPTPTGETPPNCPSGTYWHPQMNHCMPVTPSPTPSCPQGRVWSVELGRCVPGGPTVTPQPTTEECPEGYRWHPDMGHCMPIDQFPTETPTPTETPKSTSSPTPSCPPGREWSTELNRCVPSTTTATPAPTTTDCPPGYQWHPDMGHCMPLELFKTQTPTP